MDLSVRATHSAIRRARALLHSQDKETLREQLRIVEIPAPSFREGERAAYLHRRFRELELADVHYDAAGNVLACLPSGHDEPPGHSTTQDSVLLSAHLDTVFPAETDLSPRQQGNRVWAPGITDNARGLAAVLALARVLMACGIRTRRPVWFIATVGEEGAGDLYGVKHLFRPDSPFVDASAFISLDGSGLRRIVHRGIGSRRLRAYIRGPGGHSWSDFGLANPVHALGTAIARLRALELPTRPATTLTVGRCGGGTSVNAIPTSSWLEVDLRSEAAAPLCELEEAARGALQYAVDQENTARRAGTPELSLEVEVIGDRPSGSLAADHPLVQSAVQATRALGVAPELVASSTDANVPIALGIPAITVGAGGESGGIHTPQEWYDNRGGARGLERALLITLAASGLLD